MTMVEKLKAVANSVATTEKCYVCDGSGDAPRETTDAECPECGGVGTVRSYEEIDSADALKLLALVGAAGPVRELACQECPPDQTDDRENCIEMCPVNELKDALRALEQPDGK